MNPVRHHVRLDQWTQDALEEICRHTFSTKSALMRRYIREGVRREAEECADQIGRVRQAVGRLAEI